MARSGADPAHRPLSSSTSTRGTRSRAVPAPRSMTRGVVAAGAVVTLLLTAALATPASADVGDRASLKADLCYQIVTDRFHDGDPTNNDPAVSVGLHDPTRQNWKLYWGGDFAGIGQRLPYLADLAYELAPARSPGGHPTNTDPAVSVGLHDPTRQNWKLYWGGDFAGIGQRLPYLADLGVTAIWLSPHVDNINQAAVYDGVPNAGYHGYWTRDFFRTEEHFGTLADFDDLIAAAHAAGIKVVMDWAPNHTSPADPADSSFAEGGALYADGVFVGDYLLDPAGLFHHNGGVADFNDLYQSQYHNLFDLADLEQQHPTVDAYLKDAVSYWLARGVDGVRIDAVKHMTAGWQRSAADHILAQHDAFLFGEWFLSGPHDPLYPANVRFANDSGISVLDFYLNNAVRAAFGQGASMRQLDEAIAVTGADYRYPENLVTFVDNHDMPRFLTLRPDPAALHRALAFLLTVRGTPCLYYGTEQYLHNDTDGGGDPYNRPMMPGFGTGTTEYQLIQHLRSLRAQEPALAWGTHRER